MFKTALYVTKGFVLSLFELLGCTWPRTQGSCAPLARSSRRATLPCAPGASAVGRCLSLLTPELLTRSLRPAQKPKELGRSWKSGTCPPQEQGGEGTGKETNTNRCTDRSEHVKEQMGADHHRTSKVASANVAPGDKKSQCHPFALSCSAHTFHQVTNC